MTPQEFQLIDRLVRALDSHAAAIVKLAEAIEKLPLEPLERIADAAESIDRKIPDLGEHP